MNKSYLRKIFKEKRKNLDKVEKVLKDKQIYDKFINSHWYKNANIIFIYVGMKEEIDTIPIINKILSEKKTVVVPKIDINNKMMKSVEIKSLKNLIIAEPYGILEPLSFENEVNKSKIDLAIIPGLIFDRFGGRLGYGGGYYDKFIRNLNDINKVVLLSLAYDFQIINHVPMAEHDLKIDTIITNNEIITINSKE